jgi:Ni/Co efflux regulator RcnB
MKKVLSIALLAASLGIIGSASAANANTVVKTSPPQVRIQIGQRHRRWHNRDWENRGDRIGYGRTTIQTRLVQRGFHTYRETYQIRYRGDGRVETNLISRVRVN